MIEFPGGKNDLPAIYTDEGAMYTWHTLCFVFAQTWSVWSGSIVFFRNADRWAAQDGLCFRGMHIFKVDNVLPLCNLLTRRFKPSGILQQCARRQQRTAQPRKNCCESLQFILSMNFKKASLSQTSLCSITAYQQPLRKHCYNPFVISSVLIFYSTTIPSTQNMTYHLWQLISQMQ